MEYRWHDTALIHFSEFTLAEFQPVIQEKNSPEYAFTKQITYLRGLMLWTRAYILSSDLSRPYASAAAVGSLITLKTFKPEICPASFVA